MSLASCAAVVVLDRSDAGTRRGDRFDYAILERTGPTPKYGVCEQI